MSLVGLLLFGNIRLTFDLYVQVLKNGWYKAGDP